MKKILWILIGLVIIGGAYMYWQGSPMPIGGAEDDVLTPGQQLEVRVVVDTPASGATVGQTFSVTGKAPGPWYFEASFPIEVRDANGTVVGQGIATALSDWMTVDDVNFEADVTMNGYTGPATLVLMRDNPSALPENDGSVSMSIVVQ